MPSRRKIICPCRPATTCTKNNKKSYITKILFAMPAIGMLILYITYNFHSVGNQVSDLNNIKRGLNYASKYMGGKVVKVLSTSTYIPPGKSLIEKFNNVHWKIVFGDKVHASEILDPVVYPGKCWPFSGTKGVVILKLSKAVRVTGMAIKHASYTNITSAPKNVILSGLKSLNDKKEYTLGNYKYRAKSSPDQFFFVKNRSPIPYEYIKINVTSNWGNNNYTCIYGVEIYGKYN